MSNKPIIWAYYQHKYGGIYQIDLPCAKSTVDKSEWVAYTHVYPFTEETYIRPLGEFMDGRFRQISSSEFAILLSKDREQFQDEITKAKE
jgi:hypothetical protein